MWPSRQEQRAWFVLCGLAVVGIVGCGSPLLPVADVQGVLTFEGNPLANYSVFFLSPDGIVATGKTDEGGKFTLKTGDRDGAPVGECKVYVQEPRERVEFAPDEVVDLTTEDIYKMQLQRRNKPRDPEIVKLGVPPKYSSPENSGLKFTVDVDASKNVCELNLTK